MVETEHLGGRVRVEIDNRLTQRQVVVRRVHRRDDGDHDDTDVTHSTGVTVHACTSNGRPTRLPDWLKALA